ncbi:MAG: alcohol dehydrogenase catalytic domain-containing protein [Anaerolineae bacterium]|nr:alcohol dehydrogenase catalytic domain-containing protein [Anaerolineae bacterium]
MNEKYQQYEAAEKPLPERYLVLPVYGAGLDNVGNEEGGPISVPMNVIGPDQLLVRHDADSICFSDIKVIKQGQDHPRIYQNMKENPVVLGHELTMTIVQVGENLKGKYHPGERFTIQADIYENGVSYAYGYYYQGGMSQFGVIDQRVLCSDGGNNNLLPIQKTTGYAEGALAEPWACVVAAYGLQYRRKIKPGGKLWIIGAGEEREVTFFSTIEAGDMPAIIYLTNVETVLRKKLLALGESCQVEIVDVETPEKLPVEYVDDIVVLGYSKEIIETASTKLDQFGVFCVMSDQAKNDKVSIDLGRVHYHRWLFIGDHGTNVANAYQKGLVRNSLKPGGTVLFAGAGGPIGRMHLQRAIEFSSPPSRIVCTDVSDLRIQDMRETYEQQAVDNGIDLVFLNPMNKDHYQDEIEKIMQSGGFDDVVVLAPVVPLIEEVSGYLANDGLMNVFAGIARGTMVNLDYSRVINENIRFIGHSGSALDDMQLTLHKIESRELNANRTVAAIGSLHYGKDGLRAVQDASYPGKVVIYNHIKELPITPIADFKEKFPSVFALFKNGEWTNEAEKEFLGIMLAD